MRRIAWLFVPLLLLSVTPRVEAKSKDANSDAKSGSKPAGKAPKDFKVVFRSSSGELAKGTKDQVEISRGKASVHRTAQLVGSQGMSNDDHSYDISDDQLDELYQIVVDSGFMTWPKTSESSHQSTVEESFEITADGKTVKHERWEAAIKDSFRTFFDRYNTWFNSIRTARF